MDQEVARTEAASEAGSPTGRSENRGVVAGSDLPSRYDTRPSGDSVYVFRLQELLEIPGELVPEETKAHLKNAGREALLAVYSLWQSISNAQKSPKVRRRIDIE